MVLICGCSLCSLGEGIAVVYVSVLSRVMYMSVSVGVRADTVDVSPPFVPAGLTVHSSSAFSASRPVPVRDAYAKNLRFRMSTSVRAGTPAYEDER